LLVRPRARLSRRRSRAWPERWRYSAGDGSIDWAALAS